MIDQAIDPAEAAYNLNRWGSPRSPYRSASPYRRASPIIDYLRAPEAEMSAPIPRGANIPNALAARQAQIAQGIGASGGFQPGTAAGMATIAAADPAAAQALAANVPQAGRPGQPNQLLAALGGSSTMPMMQPASTAITPPAASPLTDELVGDSTGLGGRMRRLAATAVPVKAPPLSSAETRLAMKENAARFAQQAELNRMAIAEKHGLDPNAPNPGTPNTPEYRAQLRAKSALLRELKAAELANNPIHQRIVQRAGGAPIGDLLAVDAEGRPTNPRLATMYPEEHARLVAAADAKAEQKTKKGTLLAQVYQANLTAGQTPRLAMENAQRIVNGLEMPADPAAPGGVPAKPVGSVKPQDEIDSMPEGPDRDAHQAMRDAQDMRVGPALVKHFNALPGGNGWFNSAQNLTRLKTALVAMQVPNAEKIAEAYWKFKHGSLPVGYVPGLAPAAAAVPGAPIPLQQDDSYAD